MARPLRLHVPGAFYHVTLRGNHRQPIFHDDGDRVMLERIVQDVIETQRARVHAYCWMTNHIHLLVQVSDVPLGRIMLRIASQFARRVQARVPTTGHLFERRYHATLVNADAYLLAVIRYIHNNPLVAGLAKSLDDYAWSSHPEYAGTRSSAWITTDFALAMLSADRARAVASYFALMQCPVENDLDKSAAPKKPPAGDNRLGGRAAAVDGLARTQETLEDLFAAAIRHFGVTREELEAGFRGRSVSVARAWIANRAIQRGVASISEIARRLGRHEASVRGLMKRHPLSRDQ